VKLPKSLNLMSVEYDVLYFDDYEKVHPEKKEQYFKYVDFYENTIRVYKGKQNINKIYELLFESIIYYIFNQFNFKLTQKEDAANKIIFNLNSILLNIFIQNNICFNNLKKYDVLKVLNVDYKILYYDDILKLEPVEAPEGIFGFFNPFTSIIKIYKHKRKLHAYWQTLIHELLHTVTYSLNIILNKNDDKEDIMIDNLATILLDVCVRNKFCFNKKCNVCKK